MHLVTDVHKRHVGINVDLRFAVTYPDGMLGSSPSRDLVVSDPHAVVPPRVMEPPTSLAATEALASPREAADVSCRIPHAAHPNAAAELSSSLAATDNPASTLEAPAAASCASRKRKAATAVATPADMSSADALAAADAEGLTLLRNADLASGYFGVRPNTSKQRPWQVSASRGGKRRYLGCFASPETAALALARAFPRLAAEHAAKKEVVAPPPPMTLAEVEQIAAAEGLTLQRDPNGKTGFRGVYFQTHKAGKPQPYKACVNGLKGQRGAGNHATPHQAALAIARFLGPSASRQLAQEKRNSGGWLISCANEMDGDTAKRLARQEGLKLRRTRDSRDYWGVKRTAAVESARWMAQFYVGMRICAETGERKHFTAHLGTFASPEGAALAVARRLRDDPPLAASVARLQSGPGGSADEFVVGGGAGEELLEADEAVVVEAWSDDEEGDEDALVVDAVAVAEAIAPQ